ncbi:tyrosine-type recombinase/integrase [Dyella psychrodurans]|uniref:Integrase n=1 Tax=Dyella psychrodurans TaxID=1927960 RepID=A0A370WY19_9GAMM|nr:tyrosine-type recombinase/integrase [Dyella psychrodurans]RDS81012.1 integrase [Dyella psychrodurans]
MSLDTVKARENLSYRREPYWQKLAQGQFLGFRPSKRGKGGNWIARYYDPNTQKKELRTLGDFGHLLASERFSAASKEAREWFAHLSGGGVADSLTVGDACDRYADGRPEAHQRFTRYVYSDPIANIRLDKLASRNLADWRKRLERTAVMVSQSEGSNSITRPRSVASVNRDMVPLRAALNKARDDGYVLTDMAWRLALKPAKVTSRRNLYLDKSQRLRLLEALPPDVSAFYRGLCLLPVRPGVLAALQVKDFNKRTGELVVEHDKVGGGRRLMLPDETAAFFKAQTIGKLPSAYLFTRMDGRPWNKEAWKGPIKKAAEKVNLPKDTVVYTLRHSTITDLVTDGLDLLTVAQIAGTSVVMIEKHYGHLKQEHAKLALAKLGL